MVKHSRMAGAGEYGVENGRYLLPALKRGDKVKIVGFMMGRWGLGETGSATWRVTNSCNVGEGSVGAGEAKRLVHAA